MRMSRHAIDELDREDLQQTVTQLMTALPELEQLVLSLYYGDELTFQEIGCVLLLPASHVAQLHTQAMQGLRDQLYSQAIGTPADRDPTPQA
jgi:RNA polymerase sigma factor for flagellar operon FliA